MSRSREGATPHAMATAERVAVWVLLTLVAVLVVLSLAAAALGVLWPR